MEELAAIDHTLLGTPEKTFSPVNARVFVVFSPLGSATLLLVVDFDADLATAVSLLQETCFRRDHLVLHHKKLLGIFAESLPPEVAAHIGSVKLDRDVHQLLLAGKDLAAALPADVVETDAKYQPAGFMKLVYREERRFRSDPAHTSMRYPAELNRPFGTLCAHGRGVTVLVGAAEHVEWGVVMTAVELVAALGQLRRIRLAASKALTDAGKLGQRTAEPGQVRSDLGKLTRRLGDLGVDMSFGVDAYLDALRFPEIVLQSYRDSLAETLGIADGATRTAHMLRRLENVLTARREELAAVEEREADIRRKRTRLAAGWVTLIAVPLTVILGFLGANAKQVNNSDSVFAWQHYWPYYAGLLGIVLVAVPIFLGAWAWGAYKIPRIRD